MRDWIILKTYTYQHEAELAQAYLNDEGIQVIVSDELMNQLHAPGIGGVKLMVHQNDYDKCLELLKEI